MKGPGWVFKSASWMIAGRVVAGLRTSDEPIAPTGLKPEEQIAWLAEENVVTYDMGPLMDYKQHWTETRIGMEVLLLRPRRATAG